MDYSEGLLSAPEALWKLAGGEASPRAGTTGSIESWRAPRQGRGKARRAHSVAPAGAHVCW